MPAPAWAHELIDGWADEGHVGLLTFKYVNGGRIARAMPRGPAILPPPDEGERLRGTMPPLCPQCAGPTTVRNDGRKVSCPRCQVSWSVADYRAEIKRVLLGKGKR